MGAPGGGAQWVKCLSSVQVMLSGSCDWAQRVVCFSLSFFLSAHALCFSLSKNTKFSGKCFGVLSGSWLKNSLAWKNSFGKEDPTLDGFCALSVLVGAKKTPEANSASEPVSMQFLMLHAVLPHGLSMSHLSFRWSPTSLGAASPLPRPAWHALPPLSAAALISFPIHVVSIACDLV